MWGEERGGKEGGGRERRRETEREDEKRVGVICSTTWRNTNYTHTHTTLHVYTQGWIFSPYLGTYQYRSTPPLSG